MVVPCGACRQARARSTLVMWVEARSAAMMSPR
jgi:hypothetical protein